MQNSGEHKTSNTAATVHSTKKSLSTWLTVDELLSLETKTDTWLVDKLIPNSAISGLTGPSDCGKSTLAKQLALCVASKKGNFLGRELNIKHGRALYVCTEESTIDVKSILSMQIEGLGIESISTAAFLFNAEDLLRRLKAALINKQVDLIVLDTWSDTLEGDANSMHVIRRNLKPLQQLATEFECSILLIHHNVKNSEKGVPDKNKASGSQAFEAKCRCLLDLRLGSTDTNRILTLIKANMVKQDEKGKGIVLTLDDYRLLHPTGEENEYTSSERNRYDKQLWQKRFDEILDSGKSNASIYRELREKYPDDEIPGDTWFKLNISRPNE